MKNRMIRTAKGLFTLTAGLLLNGLFAQNITCDWLRFGNTIDASVHPQQTVSDNDGNIFICGHFGDKLIFNNDTLFAHNPPFTDIFLVKYDSSGNYLWSKSFGTDASDYGYGIAADASGHIYIAGQFTGDSLPLGSITLYRSRYAGFVAMFDNNGNAQWAQATQSGGYFGQDDARAVAVDAGGNVYITGGFGSDTLYFGNSFITRQGPNTGPTNIYVAKLLPGGIPDWIRGEEPGSDPGFNTGKAITTDANGNVYLCGIFGGARLAFGSRTYGVFDYEECIGARLDPSTGDVVWARAIRGYSPQSNTYDGPTDVFTDHAGHVYVGGYYFGLRCSFDSLYTITSPVNQQNPLGEKIFLFKLDVMTGLPLWGKGYGDDAGGDVTVGGWAISNNDQRIALCGLYEGAPLFGAIQLPQSTAQSRDGYILEMDSSGVMLRGVPLTGGTWDVGADVDYDAFGKLVCTGFANSYQFHFGNQLTNNFPQDPFYNLFVCRISSSVAVSVEEEDLSIMQLFPNPVADVLFIQRMQADAVLIRIYDSRGRIVQELQAEGPQVRVDVSGLAAGRYEIECVESAKILRGSFIRR